MSDQTGISWTDSTLNFWWGCTKHSAGCKNCYADTLSGRYGHDCFGPKNPRRPINWEQTFKQIIKRVGEKSKNGTERLMVFVNDMSDLFERPETMPQESRLMVAERRRRAFGLFEDNPGLIFQVLTKRPDYVMECVPRGWEAGFPENVWLGTSVEDQKAADERIPHLLRCPAAVRFLSCEPLLGPVEIDMPYWCCKRCGNPFPPDADPEDDASWEPYPEWENGCPRCGVPNYVDASWLDHDNIHWVIVGGESGPGRREMRLEWLEGIVRQCQAAGVPVFVKQASGARPGMQGGIPDRIWGLKQFPEVSR